MRADYDRVAYAIPSPARREVKGWVLAPVPLCPRATAETAAKKARG
jgi:hypothetical protein